MAGADRPSKGEVLDVVGEDSGAILRSLVFILGAMENRLLVSFMILKIIKVFHPFVC